jgi:hypothetical protein
MSRRLTRCRCSKRGTSFVLPGPRLPLASGGF